MEALGFPVYCIDSPEQIGGILDENTVLINTRPTPRTSSWSIPFRRVFLDMGLGKSVITLTAIFDLCLDSFLVRKVLVIAPLRVAADTWPCEIEKWDHLRGLTYSVAVGSEAQRKAALLQRVSVYITSTGRMSSGWWRTAGYLSDYDMVVIDELSSFKSYQAKRFRALLKVRPGVKRIVGLTGTPSSNGLMDLWAEFRVLDMGKRLGRFITHYRTAFFQPDKRNAQVVFSYKPLPGAEDAIYEKISDITISMRAGDYLDMPECVVNGVKVTPLRKGAASLRHHEGGTGALPER